MRKRTLWLIPAALVLGWVYASPYLAVRNLKQAALDGNTDSLREGVDFPALRASLKEELGGQLSKQALNEMKNDGNGFAALGSALVGGFVNLMIDQLVTPRGIASIVQGKRVDGTPDELAGTIERFAAKPQSGVNQPEANISEGYESLDRFCVRIFLLKSDAPITLVYLRSGLTSWRLSAIRLPDLDELTKETDNAKTVPPRQPHQPEGEERTATADGMVPHESSAITERGSIPFVGCPSDGQAGPIGIPNGSSPTVLAGLQAAQRLAYYKADLGPGVLAPRGWYCSGTYGSNGETVFVGPQPIADDMGAAIELSRSSGGTSGRFEVARMIARVFPAHRDFASRVIGEGLVPAADFPFGPYPLDRLNYKNDEIVEYETPARADGLGTCSGLRKNDSAINGVVILSGPTPDLLVLSVRLPPEFVELTAPIIQQAERDAQSR
ncbi:MAG: DUF2939 domain-containing protein [Bryobacteraceae bacterium]